MRRLVLAFLLAALLLPLRPAAAQSETPDALINMVNQYRAANGMGPFEVNANLMAAAQGHANWLATTHAHSHTGEGGTTPQDRATMAGYKGLAFENYASGTINFVTMDWAVNTMWSNSGIHRAIMLSSNVHVGAGVADNDQERYYVLVVGSPVPDTPTPPPGGNSSSGNSTGSAAEEEEDGPDAIAMVPIMLAPPREDGSIVHVVQMGQTAWDIAARYGISLDELLALNYLDRADPLHPGDEVLIKLAEGQPTPLPPTEPASYVVQDGETVWSIAMQYDLTVDQLLELNGLTRENVIKAGDTLLLRPPDPTATPTIPPTNTLAPTPTLTLTPTILPTVAVVWAGTPTGMDTVSATPAATFTLPATPTIAPTIPPSLTPTRAAAPRVTRSDSGTNTVMGIGVIGVGVGLAVLAGAAFAFMRRPQE